jgi:hypothetical protein
MRFGYARVAAVSLLSGGFLTVGALGSAQAAPVLSQGKAAVAATPVCQALPASPSPSPTPTSIPTPTPAPSPTTTPSPTGSPSTGVSSTAASAKTTPTGSSTQTKSASSGPTGSAAQTSSSATNSTSSSRSSASPTATASLDVFVASSPSGGTSSSAAASSAGTPELCVSVQGGQSSIERGQTATYTVQVSTKNGSASGVSVALTSQPSSQKPEFTSGCAKGDGTASCTVSSVTATQPANLHAQIAVASNATSVTSVKLTATASIASTVKWTPPAAAGSTSVTAAAAVHSAAKAASPTAAAPTASLPPVALGPIPNLNAEASQLINAGNASGLFPAVKPAATSTTSPAGDPPASRQDAGPLVSSSAVSAGSPVYTAQVAGLIALGLAIMLTVTRLSRRKRSGSRRTGS